MLILHQSNRLEQLASSLANLLHSLPMSQVFTPETIVIQSQGMRRYVNQHLAQHNGIAANLEFNLPARFMWKIMQQNLGQLPKLSPFSSSVLHWRLMQLFEDLSFQQDNPAAQYLASYIDSRPEAYFDLSFILADIFDQYLVYRSDWTETWQQHKTVGLGPDEAWQANLWQQLILQESHDGEHRLQLWQRFLAALPTAQLPERIWVFGITSMAPMYLDLLRSLSQYTDVHIFATNPSQEFWGDVTEPSVLLRRHDSMTPEEATRHQGHPLLASLGKQGRDFFNALTSDIEYHYNLDLFVPNPNTTLLARLQNDLLYLRTPTNTHEGNAALSGLNHPDLQDGSIVISSAHSALRELQILKDHIIRHLAQNPTWSLQDVAVLTPKVDAYLPFLEAVFGPNCPDGKPLAYTVADVKLSRQQPYLQAIEQFMHVMDSRFELLDVLPLLDAPALQQRFGWSRDDVAVLHATIRDLNIRWGLDENMRQQYGGEGDAFTWDQALQRVVMGWLLPQNSQHIAWHEQTPYDSEPSTWPLLSQLWHLVHVLRQWHSQWQEAADIPTWIQRINTAVSELFVPLESDVFTAQQWQQHLATWQQEAAMAHYEGCLSFAIVKRHTNSFLQQESQAGFLRGGLTFCSLVPMRGLPFEMVCMLGMNDGEFPRDTKAPSFDLMYQHGRSGDRSRRDDDRYVFLETTLNARSQLYLSYIGKNIKNDEHLAASTVIYEFVDTLAAMVGALSQDLIEGTETQPAWITAHPLQAFSPRYFQQEHHLYSHRHDIAQALNTPQQPIEAFIDGAYQTQLQAAPTTHTAMSIHMDEWQSFWKNPTRQWLKKQLAWKDTYSQEVWPEQELFTLDDATKALVYEALYEARRQRQPLDEAALHILKRNQLPMGQLSHMHMDQLKQAVLSLPQSVFEATTLPPLETAYAHRFDDGSEVQLQISLRHRTDIGQVFWFQKKPTAPDKITIWLEHLAFCAFDDNALAQESFVVWAENPWYLRPVEPAMARKLVIQSLALMRLGTYQPLPFFARASLAAADAWHKKLKKSVKDNLEPSAEQREEAQLAAKQAARSAFLGSGARNAGQLQQEEGLTLVYGHSEALPIETALFDHIVQEICVPMQAYMVGGNLTDEDEDGARHAS